MRTGGGLLSRMAELAECSCPFGICKRRAFFYVETGFARSGELKYRAAQLFSSTANVLDQGASHVDALS